MKRALLIARREYLAYARTVGFWLSLLALPFFAVLGGSVPFLMERSEPISQVVLVEAPGEGPSLTAAVRAAMDRAALGRQAQALRAAARIEAGPEAADGVRDVAEREGYEAGLAELRRVAPQAAAGFSTPRERIRIIDPTPADLTELASAPDPAAVLAPWFEGERLPGEVQLDSAVILNRADGAPSAVVWSRRATDDTVEDAVRAALVEVNRREALTGAGLADTVVDDVQRFRPQVQMFSPASVSGGEVSLRDRLPGIIGLALGFLLWSLVVTGASMLMNSVMEEKANKVMEVLMSSASSAEILAGKVLGVAALTGTVLLAWGAMGAAGFAALIPEIGADVAAVDRQAAEEGRAGKEEAGLQPNGRPVAPAEGAEARDSSFRDVRFHAAAVLAALAVLGLHLPDAHAEGSSRGVNLALLSAVWLLLNVLPLALPLAYALLPHSYRLHQKAVRAAWFSHSALTCLVAVLLLQHLVLCQRSHRSSAGRHSHRYPGEVDDCVNTYQ